jgi:coronin-1B/1C/6
MDEGEQTGWGDDGKGAGEGEGIQRNVRISELEEENTQLTGELRDAREMIRNLELQVEAMKANAKKAQALLDS